jgi:DNA-directed RNA polymerase subunit M/transcription elongation factor TFIIS
MVRYCKHADNIVQFEKRGGCKLCALEKEVRALAQQNYKLREALVIKEHEAALRKEVEAQATDSQQPQAEICPRCSIDGTLYNSATGKWDIVCDLCGGTGKLSAVR